MGQFKPMVKMMTTEPSVELKLKKGGAVKKAMGGGMMGDQMPSFSSMKGSLGAPRGGLDMAMAPKKPSMAKRKKAMSPKASSKVMSAMPAMKKGGDMAQDKAMVKKAFKQHDAQEHKGGKGTKLSLKKGGRMATGGVTMGNAGGYATGGVVLGNAGGFKHGGVIKSTSGKTKMVTAQKKGKVNYATGGVALGNAGGFANGGNARKVQLTMQPDYESAPQYPKKQNYGKYGFDKPLVRYLRNQRKMSATDGGVDYDYDPRTETFTGGMMGGQTVTKTLKEMMADATKPKLRPRDILNMPRETKPNREGRQFKPFSTDTFNPIKPPRPSPRPPTDEYDPSRPSRPPRPSPRPTNPQQMDFVMPRTPDAQIAAPPPVGMKKGGKAMMGGGMVGGNMMGNPMMNNGMMNNPMMNNGMMSGYKKGGAPKKFAEGGSVQDDGRPQKMPQGNKPPSKPVSTNRLAGSFKKGGGVRRMAGGGSESDYDSMYEREMARKSAEKAANKSDNEEMRDMILGVPKRILQGAKRMIGMGEGSDKEPKAITKTERSVTISPAKKKRGGAIC